MTQNGLSTNDISSLINKSWTLRDQKVAFAGNFVPSLNPIASLVDPVVSGLHLNRETIKPGLLVEGQDLTNLILNQALEYFQKALYNFNSHYVLANRGFSTWASVTNYYSSYFSVFALLSLQGRVITKFRLTATEDIPCMIHPEDFKVHKYIITSKEAGGKTHQVPWKKYYTIYDTYQMIKPEFDVVQSKSFVTESIDETEERNKINYRIFEGFQEVLNLADITTFRTQYSDSLASPVLGENIDKYLDTLRSLSTDPSFKYFARSALRLILIKSIFEEIGQINNDFKLEYERRVPIWQTTLFDIYAPPTNYYENFVNTFLN
ncbi:MULTISPECIES: hypothetical protein [unclassified Pedobacter]|uniref:hypothetical protein n=1 Tax=unclassified Pedobacter TaxID=2628915 RepID=UPI001DB89732|nr:MULTISPECIES: hypothetical protein [unclassified Pedobacter]CAH0137616.1 hypothetical protein SRABI126_00206 [Pedobacter sp. Bi126]CAH0220801.1 hypothetical protein SRABI36_02475 [Pedobacter sp. Bi36]